VLERWTRTVLRFRVAVLGLWLAVVVVGVWSTTRLSPLLSNSFAVPGTDSDRARTILTRNFGERTDGTFTVVFRVPTASDPRERLRARRRLADAALVVPTGHPDVVRPGAGVLWADIDTNLDLRHAKRYTEAIRESLQAERGPAAFVTGHRRALLQHVCAGPGGERLARVVDVVERGEHDNRRLRRGSAKGGDCLEADAHVHDEIEQDDVRFQLLHSSETIIDPLALTDGLDADLGVQQEFHPPANDTEVVDHHCSDAGHVLDCRQKPGGGTSGSSPIARRGYGRSPRTARPPSHSAMAADAPTMIHSFAAPAASATPANASASTRKSAPSARR
jgi:hypothetical protein